ncbi:uncharacterized protein zgc:112408 [Entelurus aequoreus]|uniref:uncharacterized protein zgc:112408 n=1 Tax=Entelurus aequoreus TaxID=161455 RepID=UPI002B1E29F9|nr:uncharacterized protein zgc:112408 [Entelurus aequoreus]
MNYLNKNICFVFQVVQHYERAVIFRLGRVVTKPARGPGVFWFIPWLDITHKVDLRIMSFSLCFFPSVLIGLVSPLSAANLCSRVTSCVFRLPVFPSCSQAAPLGSRPPAWTRTLTPPSSPRPHVCLTDLRARVAPPWTSAPLAQHSR